MNEQQEREALPPLPEPHAKVNGKLGTYCSFESTEARRGDAVYTADQMHAYARAAQAATPAQNLSDPAVQKRLAAQWGYVPAMAATPAPAPQGWKLVPVEPTRDMTAAGRVNMNYFAATAEQVWAAMLAAAPEAATPAPEPLKERPDFIAGYDAGLIDGRACERRDRAEAQPVQDEREAFEKLIPRIGGMTHWHIFQAGAEHARAALAATPATAQDEEAGK